VAYLTPHGTRVDCFIGNCYNLPWLINHLYILGFVPLMVGHHSIHTLEMLGRQEAQNLHQHWANDQNPQADDLE
jgi:hypothetical protein